MGTKLKIAAVLAATAIAAAGCGSSGSSGSSGVSAASYVSAVCSAATNWRDAIQSAGGKLSSGVNTKSLTKAKSEYVTFVGSLVAATAQAESTLRSAGAPSVSGGKQIADSLVKIFTTARTTLAAAATQAAALPTTSVKAFETAAGRVVSSIRGSLAGMSSVTPERNAALRSAASKDKTCQSLASSG